MSLHNNRGGFTLIELLVVMAVIAIVASFAVPMYQEQMIKTRRSDGKAALLSIMSLQERYFTMQHSYTTTLGVGGLGMSAEDGVYLSENQHYSLSASACGVGITTCVQLTATPLGSQVGDGNLTYDAVGNKLPADKW